MNDAIAIPLEFAARPALARIFAGKFPATRCGRIGSKGSAVHHAAAIRLPLARRQAEQSGNMERGDRKTIRPSVSLRNQTARKPAGKRPDWPDQLQGVRCTGIPRTHRNALCSIIRAWKTARHGFSTIRYHAPLTATRRTRRIQFARADRDIFNGTTNAGGFPFGKDQSSDLTISSTIFLASASNIMVWSM